MVTVGYQTVAVKSVVTLNEVKETFDIEVEDNHQFYCEGYLVHNSALISIGSPYDDEFMDLKNYELNPERINLGWASNNSVSLKRDKGL